MEGRSVGGKNSYRVINVSYEMIMNTWINVYLIYTRFERNA
jgi:hypothetical protein